MSAGGVRAGSAYVEIFAKDGKFQQAMASVQAKMQSVSKSMRQFGTQAAMGGAAMGAPMVMALQQFTAFDDAIRATGAVSQATAPQLASLTAKARELGATTSFTATQVAQLMTELGRAGFKPDEIEAMTGAVMNLARATGTDAALSAGIMAATIRQFGMEAADATRVSDVLTGAANKSFNTVEALGEALSYAGITAAQAGMSIEETAAILGTLGNVGIQGSNAGTALRRLLTITGAEAVKLKEIFGVSFLDAAGNVRPLVDTLGEVALATNNLASGERLAKFNEAFGLLGITGAQAIAGTVADTRKLAAELEAAGGIAAKTAGEMDAGLGGSMRILLSAVEGVSLAFGDALAPSIMIVAGVAQGLADWLRQFIVDFPLVAQLAAGFAAGLFSVGTGAIVASLAIGGIAKAIGGISSLLASLPMLLNPVVMALAGIGAVAGIIAWAFSKTAKATKEIKDNAPKGVAAQAAKETKQAMAAVQAEIRAAQQAAAAGGSQTSIATDTPDVSVNEPIPKADIMTAEEKYGGKPAVAGPLGRSVGTFGDGAGLGVGPELSDPMEETAKNTRAIHEELKYGRDGNEAARTFEGAQRPGVGAPSVAAIQESLPRPSGTSAAMTAASTAVSASAPQVTAGLDFANSISEVSREIKSGTEAIVKAINAHATLTKYQNTTLEKIVTMGGVFL